MKTIRYLHIDFDNEIKTYEIPAFRGAIIDKAGRENMAFHNHLDDTRYSYGYPVIQYKVIRGKAALVCLDYGVDEIHHFFNNKSLSIQLSGRTLDLKISTMHIHPINLQVGAKSFRYKIQSWLPLNQDNFIKYRQLNDLKEKIEMLERIMIGNIISMAKSVKWNIDQEIRTKVLDISSTKPMTYKSQQLLSFDLEFETNVYLPNYIGLGKAVSHGFGVIKSSMTHGN